MNSQANEDKKQQAAIDALKSLESYNYREQTVTIGEVKIILAPLTSAEIIDVFDISGKHEDSDAAIHSLKIETVARSIIKVNGVNLDPKGMLQEKLQIVSSFGDELVDVLFSEYCVLDKVIKAAVENRENTNLTKVEEGQ